MPNTKPTRDQFRDYVRTEFAPVTTLDEARGLVVSLPAVHLPFVVDVARRLGLDVRDAQAVGERAQVRIFSFRRTPRTIPAAAMRQFNNRHED